jgi:hypothetical protein
MLVRLEEALMHLVSTALAMTLAVAGISAAQSSPPCTFPLVYPGDSAPREAIAAWLAARAAMVGVSEELPVMAALVESGAQSNFPGDGDSVGFFQMRISVWNQGVYHGYPEKPQLQVKWFLDQAAAVRNNAILNGDRSYVETPAGYGRWIDEALRPSKARRATYQQALEPSRKLIADGRVLAGSWPFAGEIEDAAPRETVAAWLATRAIAEGLPPELPIMAALVESGLQNLPSDGSFAGYFRMSELIWNGGQYDGFARKPELQIKWFIDQAAAVRAARITAGEPFFGADPQKWGEWIADVERPAEQLRGRYQLRLDEARLLMEAGCMTR